MGEILFHIGMGLMLVVILVIGYSCLVMASESDKISEEQYEECCRRNNDE